MTKPIPYIRAYTVEKRVAVLRAIHNARWLFAYYNTFDEMVADLSSASHTNHYPIIHYGANGRFWCTDEPQPNWTMVNSGDHLIDYCRAYYQPYTRVS